MDLSSKVRFKLLALVITTSREDWESGSQRLLSGEDYCEKRVEIIKLPRKERNGFPTLELISVLYESPVAFSRGSASIGANGAIISPARLDRSWLSKYLSEAGSNVSEKTARFESPSLVTSN
jgi:hypothetical protein